MAEYLRAKRVRTILDFGFTKFMPLDELRAAARLRLRDAARAIRTCIFGHWLQIDPHTRRGGRCASSTLHRGERRIPRLLHLGIGHAASSRATRSTRRSIDVHRAHDRRSWSSSARPAPAPGCPAAAACCSTSAIRATSTSSRSRCPTCTSSPAAPAWPWQDDMICGADAQAQRVERGARLVAEVLHRRAQARDPLDG